MSRPIWKRLWSTDYSQLFVDETGVYSPELEIAQEIHDSATGDDPSDEDTGNTFEVFRFSLDRQKRVTVADDETGTETTYIVPEGYQSDWPHPVSSYPEWFIKDLASIARSIGCERSELIDDLCSDDPSRQARAYESIGGYHGYNNLDSDPLTLTLREFNKRWEE